MTDSATTLPAGMVEVTQADRDAAAAWIGGDEGAWLLGNNPDWLLSSPDADPLVQAFARHRLAATRPAAATDAGEVERRAIARCIEIVRETRDGFLSEEYATDQPLSSFHERFACDQCADAIEREFGMGTIEQRRLLGKPTPGEEYRAALAGSGGQG